MPQHFLSPDQLQDRPWRPGHPLNRNPSAKRRAMMLTLFVILCSIIGGYLYITDPKRVEKMAENELSRLIGGHITIGAAKLSLFEGLRLEQVKLYVDNQMEADSLLFSANAFHVNYDPRALLTGRLKLTQMVAIDPHVVLTENLDTGKWNYQRMRRPEPSPTDRTPGGPLPALPQIVLRNAQIDYSETLRGEQVSRGTMAIEGQLAPSSNGQVYTFELQSRGGNVAADKVAVGPTVTGSLDRDSGTVTAAMRDFKFGQDIRAMLPAQVRAWWDRHSLSGSVDIPILSYTPANGTDDAKYRVQTVFRDVDLTIRPEEWMSRDEIQTRDWTAAALDSLRAAGLNSRGVVDRIAQLVDPSPIHLGRVKGRFEFTEDGIILGENDAQGRLVSGVSGVLEENLFSIDGHIDGYSPLSPAHIKISSTRMQIPAHPRYVTSMPRQVRELYDHLRPQGICELQVNVDRPAAGARLEIAGGINIVDGNFIFDRFPYPVRAATGQIIFGYDPASGMDQVKIVNLRGRGMLGGPNANSIIQMGGLIRPLNSDAGVQITVSSNDVHDEPALKAAFPEDVRKALRNLDADGKGEYPKFNGGFECRVVRPIGDKVEWIIDVDITLNDSAGKMVAFPYLMEHVTGKLLIREGYVDIVGATMKKKDDASLVIDGRVTWRAGFGGRRLEPGEVYGHVTPSRPDLKITARNVPIDKDLLGALPEDRRTWLQSVGLTGLLDIDGRVWRPVAGETAAAKSASDSDLTHAFDIILRNGTIWPVEGTFAISNLAAKLRLLPDRMSISEMSAKRGDADIAGRGEISWPQNRPAVFVSGTASKLALDRTLYRILPHAAQSAWDAVKPEGVVDLDLTYSGAVGVAEDRVSGFGVRVSDKDKIAATLPSSPETRNPKPETRPSPEPRPADFDLIIHPVKLAATVQSIPYRLEDLTGIIRLSGGKVLLTDLVGKHGDGVIRVSGSGAMQGTNWDLNISGEKITVDEEFRRALPSGLASVVQSIKLAGLINFELPRLQIRSSAPMTAPMTAPTTAPTTAPSTTAPAILASTTVPPASPLDIDFIARLAMSKASIDVGVPMANIDGKLTLEGTVRNGKLAALSGPLDVASFTLAERPAQGLHAEFFKPSDQDALRIGKITGRLAGGDINGYVDLGFPDVGASRYVMNLVMRNADVRELSGETDHDLSGELSASFAMEGDWSDPRSRRGRGDVSVNGKEMYKIPLVLGLLQITNLSLPITSPFSQGSARYMIDGEMVTFESLELRSRNMLMSGSGQLDFASKKVRMSFTTDNPNWPKLPIVGDILQTAKHELMQIHVKGTLQDPKVSATAVNTLTTTVDEVLRGDEKK